MRINNKKGFTQHHFSKNKKSGAGFTLIDTLIYAAILSMTMGSIMLVVYNIIEGRYRALARIEVEEEANFLMRKIDWALTGVSSITQPAPGATTSVLTVQKINFPTNPITIQSSSTNAAISYGGGSQTVLNSDSVIVRSLAFQGLPTTTPGVAVTLSLEFKPREQLTIVNASTTLTTTIYVRTQ